MKTQSQFTRMSPGGLQACLMTFNSCRAQRSSRWFSTVRPNARQPSTKPGNAINHPFSPGKHGKQSPPPASPKRGEGKQKSHHRMRRHKLALKYTIYLPGSGYFLPQFSRAIICPVRAITITSLRSVEQEQILYQQP